jgi:hypothetical protein
VSYRTYLKRALASGKLAKHPNVKLVKGDEKNKDTWVAIFKTKRIGMDDDFEWEVPFTEAGYMLTRDGRKPRGGMWNVQPGFQLKVRAFVQGLRIVCADIVGGLPYVIEEIQSEESEETIKNKNTSIQTEDNKPSDEEKQADKSSADRKNGGDDSKVKALEGFQARINSFDNLAGLEIWVKSQKIIEKHPYKDDILSMIEIRKKELIPSEPENTRASTINQIVNKTGKSFGDVNSYVSDEMLTSGLIAAVLSGEKGAIDDFNEGLSSFLATQNEPDLEADPEMDKPE